MSIAVSIIIVNYKTPQYVLDCVASIYKYTAIPFEIIVVDNASGDGLMAILAEKHPSIKFVQMGYNAGFARANNAGIALANGQTLLLLNSDTYLIDDAIGRCFNRLTSEPETIAAGAIQLDTHMVERGFYHTFTMQRSFWIIAPFKWADRLLEILIPQKKYKDPEQVDYIAAAFLMVKKEAIASAGMLDEEFFLYGEDTEWGWRLGKVGTQKVYKDCKIVHLEWGSKPDRLEELKSKTFFNRFFDQIHLSNLVWIRKSYGPLRFLALMMHYWMWVPVFYMIKFVTNMKDLKKPTADLKTQHSFRRSIQLYSKYFFSILFLKSNFYKI